MKANFTILSDATVDELVDALREKALIIGIVGEPVSLDALSALAAEQGLTSVPPPTTATAGLKATGLCHVPDNMPPKAIMRMLGALVRLVIRECAERGLSKEDGMAALNDGEDDGAKWVATVGQ